MLVRSLSRASSNIVPAIQNIEWQGHFGIAMHLRKKRLLALQTGGAASAPLEKLQSTAKASGVSGSVVLPSFSTPPAVGNSIVIPISTWVSQNVVSIADNRGNTYALAASTIVNAGDLRTSIWFCNKILTTGNPFTITITINPSTYYLANAIEVGGAISVDQVAGQAGGASTLSKSTGATPALTGNSIFVIAALGLRYGPTTLAVDAGWTQEYEELPSTNVPGEADSKILSGAAGTTVTCNWTLGTTSYGPSQLVAFKRG